MVAAVLAFGVGSAAAQGAFHGMGVAKGCDSPTKIGDPYSCAYAIFNTVDTAHDTLKLSGLTDVVHSAGGDVSSGNILGALQLVFNGPVTCVGGSGSGTAANPYVGATSCTLPFGSSLFTNSHSFYTVQAADFTLPNHDLTDTATVAWNDLCDGVSNNCTTGQQENSAGSSSVVEKLPTQTATSIHNAQHQVVTSVAAGSTVHDFVTVTGQPGAPVPSGTVTIDWFTNKTCTGPPATTSGAETLDANGQVDATNFPQGPLAAGLYGFLAHYGGDPTYLPSDGACEPLAVVDANISITPNGVNRVGQTHTFTAHVNVNDGTGFVNAPDGTQISFTIDSGPGSFTSPNPCTTVGATGSCTINLSSAVTGVTTVSAHTSVAVLGVVLTRNTDGTGTNSGPATKRWVNARIHIAPSATNRVGAPHTFTVTLEKDTGDGAGFVPAAGEHVDVALTDALGASHTAPTGTCINAGANTDANGQCTITFTSNATGTVTGHATSTLSVAGSAPFTVQTDGVAPNGPNAVKTFVDAKISIAPNATNQVGQPHTFTVTLLKDTGNGAGFQPAAGEHVDATLTDSNGASHTAPTGTCTSAGANTDANGQCTITFTSPTGGKVTGHATSTLNVGGVSITVATDGQSGNSGDAVKTFVDANISITPNGVNRVGSTHTFTAHVNVNDGSGGGFVNAPNGTQISFTIDSGPGSFTTSNPCTTAGGSGSCQVTLTSAVTGLTVVSAHTDVSVGGLSLHRDTNGQAGNSAPATKTWVNAKIAISPDATNEINHSHTFTVTLQKDLGDGNGFVPFANAHVDFSLTNSNGANATLDAAASTCDDAGANTNASGQCVIVFTSPTPGKVTGHASWTGTLGTPTPFTVQTDGVAPNSGDAVKTFVDANISITPNGTNRVNQAHTFTAHVNVNDGSGAGYVPAPDGTPVSFTIDSGPGHFTTSNPCTTAGGTGSCQITLTSAVTGMTVVSAHTDVTVGGVSLHRDTNGQGGNSEPATKTWVDAKISITPNATNEVGQPHTFTVTLLKDTGNGSGFQPAADEHVDVTLTDSNGASHTAPTGTCTNPSANTDANGQCTITFTSPTPGKVIGHATSTLDVGGVSITVATDGQSGNSTDAVKTFVDAYITISPPSAVNPINTIHTYTAHVFVNDGSGAGYVDAPNGTVVSFAFVGQHVGSFVAGSMCTVSNGAGTCTIDTTSTVPGTDVMSASTTVSVGGVVLMRTTGQPAPGHANSDNAAKDWVGAKITIAPNATNEVGQPHTFTITVSLDTGNGYQPAAGQHVDVTLTDAKGAAHTSPTGSCLTAGPNTDANGQCTVTFTSPTAGTVTGHATSTIPVDGRSITVSTDGTGDNSGDAVKTFVDANITIAPNATNEVGTNHTFTVTVKKNAGDGNGFVPAAGVTVATSISNANGATATVKGGTCTNATTDGNGQCTLIISSPTAGTTTANASATLTVGGVSLTRDTDPATANIGAGPNGSGPAVKTWVDANIQITPATANNPVSTTHTLTGHVNVKTGSGAFANAPAGTTISFAIITGPGSFVAGITSCTTVGTTGSCTVQITSSTTGTTVVRATTDVLVGGLTLHRASGDGKAGDSADASKNWGDDTVHTDIINAATGGIVTSVVAGTIVHDSVQVQRIAGTPASVTNPTGTVVFHRYTTADCTGTTTDQSVALTPGNPSTAISADFAPVAGSLSYKADYLGDANYAARTGACEPLAVTPVPAPAIAIVKNPKSQSIPVGATAKFTITVTNVGNTVLTNVKVTDPLSPNCNRTSAQIPALASMNPGDHVTYSCTRANVQNRFTNQATATGTPPSGPNVTATDTAPVTVTRPFVPKKVHPKVVSHKRPKATG